MEEEEGEGGGGGGGEEEEEEEEGENDMRDRRGCNSSPVESHLFTKKNWRGQKFSPDGLLLLKETVMMTDCGEPVGKHRNRIRNPVGKQS